MERRYCGGTTKFAKQTDRPPSWYRNENRKRYPAVKSRYRAAKRRPDDSPAGGNVVEDTPDTYGVWLDEENVRLTKFYDPEEVRVILLSATNNTYLKLIEAGGAADKVAAAFDYLLLVDGERMDRLRDNATAPPSVQSETELLQSTIQTLARGTADGDSWALTLLRVGLAFVGNRVDRWLWAGELFAMVALSSAKERSCDEAICLFGVGFTYATDTVNDDTMILAARFLDKARRAADRHRHDWLLPADIRGATGVPLGYGDSVWVNACFVEYEVLTKAARTTLRSTPDPALRSVECAYRLMEAICTGVDVNDRDLRLNWANAAYELGVMYTAIDKPDRATGYFGKCMAAAAGLDPDLALETELAAATARPGLPPAERNALLRRIADDALVGRNCSVLVKSLAALGFLATYDGRWKEGHRQFATARRIAVEMGHRVDSADPSRLYAAINQTCGFMRSNFSTVRARNYDLLSVPRLWTGYEQNFLVRDPKNDTVYLDADRVLEFTVKSKVREAVRKLKYNADESIL